MTDILTTIMQSISNQWVLAVIAIFTAFTYITRKSLGKFIEQLNIPAVIKAFKSKREEKFKYTIADLEQHDLFLELDNGKSSRFEFFTHDVYDATKSQIFVDFLEMLLENTKVSMLKVCFNADNEMTRVALKHLISASLQEGNYTLNRDILEKFILQGLTKDQAKIVLNKFHDIRTNTLTRYHKRVESIFACDFYENNFQLLLAVYEVIAFELDDIIEVQVLLIK